MKKIRLKDCFVPFRLSLELLCTVASPELTPVSAPKNRGFVPVI
jgi:hypothetical protein